MGFGSPDVCSMTIPKCVVVIVICAHPVVCVARGMNAAYTAHTLSVCSLLRTNAHAHAPTCALERGLSVCGPSDFFGSSSLLLVIS